MNIASIITKLSTIKLAQDQLNVSTSINHLVHEDNKVFAIKKDWSLYERHNIFKTGN